MKTSNRSLVKASALLITLGFTSLTCTTALADGKARFNRENPAGGATAGMMRSKTGPNGGGFVNGRGVITDGQGNGKFASGSAFKGPNGGSGVRAGTTTHTADGTTQHKSGFAAAGNQGNVSSYGETTVNPDGSVNQSRSTSATNAQTGNSYQGNTSYNNTDGVTHSATCYDAAGSVITCPSR